MLLFKIRTPLYVTGSSRKNPDCLPLTVIQKSSLFLSLGCDEGLEIEATQRRLEYLVAAYKSV